VVELLYEEALALGVAVAAMIQRVDGEPLGNELLGYPFVLAAVRVESMRDDNHGVRLARRLPLAREDLDAVDAFEASFSHGRTSSSRPATLHRPSQGGPTMQQWHHRASHAGRAHPYNARRARDTAIHLVKRGPPPGALAPIDPLVPHAGALLSGQGRPAWP